MAGDTSEFGEFDVTAEEFDEMLASSEPVTVDLVPRYYAQRIAREGYWKLKAFNKVAAAAAGAAGGRSVTRETPSHPAVPSPA